MSNWSEPMGGADADGNELTVSFGQGKAEGHTFLADGDASEGFFRSENHNHYGPGNGANDNAKDRGKYTGLGH